MIRSNENTVQSAVPPHTHIQRARMASTERPGKIFHSTWYLRWNCVSPTIETRSNVHNFSLSRHQIAPAYTLTWIHGILSDVHALLFFRLSRSTYSNGKHTLPMIIINIKIPNCCVRVLCSGCRHTRASDATDGEQGRANGCRITYYFRCLRQRRLYVYLLFGMNSERAARWLCGRAYWHNLLSPATVYARECRLSFRETHGRKTQTLNVAANSRERWTDPDANGNFLFSSVAFAICACAICDVRSYARSSHLSLWPLFRYIMRAMVFITFTCNSLPRSSERPTSVLLHNATLPRFLLQ